MSISENGLNFQCHDCPVTKNMDKKDKDAEKENRECVERYYDCHQKQKNTDTVTDD